MSCLRTSFLLARDQLMFSNLKRVAMCSVCWQSHLMHFTEFTVILFFAASFCLAWRQLVKVNQSKGNVDGLFVQKADTVKWYYNHFETK